MVQVERSALLGFTPAQLLALVQDIERYPEFLPACTGARIESGADARGAQRAGLQFRFAGLTEEFLTANQLRTENDDVAVLDMRLLKGPFKALQGQWRFQPLGESACKVSLQVRLDWSGWSLARLFTPQLERAIQNVMQAFKQRAEQLYGTSATSV